MILFIFMRPIVGRAAFHNILTTMRTRFTCPVTEVLTSDNNILRVFWNLFPRRGKMRGVDVRDGGRGWVEGLSGWHGVSGAGKGS